MLGKRGDLFEVLSCGSLVHLLEGGIHPLVDAIKHPLGVLQRLVGIEARAHEICHSTHNKKKSQENVALVGSRA